MTDAEPLFRPFAYKGLRLPNRIVMAPMTRLKSSKQVPDEAVAAYYRRRAEGGVGLILTEGVSPEQKSASGYRRCPAFFGEAALEGWRKTAAAVTAAGGAIMPQLWHVGPVRTPNMAPYPEEPTLSPSGLLKPDARQVGEPMTDSEIADVIEGFAKSGLYAKQLGFTGVEIHGAHGYLIDTFLWPATNLRADGYGGSEDNRRRFAIEIVKAVRARVGPDFPILFRYSQWKQQDYTAKLVEDPAGLERFLNPLTDAGIDIFHCSLRRFWEPEFAAEGSDLNLAGWTRKITGQPTMAVGSVGLDGAAAGRRDKHAEVAGIGRLVEMMDRGDFDLIAIGRALIANPDWANTVREGRFEDLKAYESEMLDTLA